MNYIMLRIEAIQKAGSQVDIDQSNMKEIPDYIDLSLMPNPQTVKCSTDNAMELVCTCSLPDLKNILTFLIRR
jgi:hypothetical protein